MKLLSENENMEHDNLIKMANDEVKKFKQANEIKQAQAAANPPPNPN